MRTRLSGGGTASRSRVTPAAAARDPLRMRKATLRLLAGAALAAALGTLAAAAGAQGLAVKFLRAPSPAIQGKVAVVSVAAPTSTLCRLSVRYLDGETQYVGQTFSRSGSATWRWRVGEVAKPGRAVLTATCGRGGRATRAVTVVGTLVPPTISVTNHGFSVRPRPTGSSASYGVMLRNTSPNADALQVYVLVNFVLANGHLIGTKAETIEAIPAGSTYAYGGMLTFPGAAPVAQLEIVVKVGGRQRHAIRRPLVANVGVQPGLRDAAWVGEVNGEIVNDHPALNLSRTKLSAVVFAADGTILGGGTGTASALLPPGTRQAFAIRSGVDAIPWAHAARAVVSPLGTYTP